GEPALELPAFAQKLADLRKRPTLALNDARRFADLLPDRAELVFPLGEIGDFLGRDLGRIAREAGKKKQQRILQLLATLRRHDQRHDLVAAVLMEGDQVAAAVSRPDLVLRPDRLANHLLLDAD